jgi:geranylgeranyl diphosphate synthase type II
MRLEELLSSKIDLLPESRVREAMRYSLMAGGKRIRPNLLYEVMKGYGQAEKRADEFACALEMIHTYSLIHDDLPAMDNDDLRRGRPTCHKQFDEATAILAGDGLLTYAFETASSSKEDPAKVQKCIAILSGMAGPSGMVLGQNLDTMETEGVTDWDALKKIHKYKTGCLLSAPLMMGAVLCGQKDEVIERWHETGDVIGLAFQVQDDILDVELSAREFGKSNSDARNDKVTSVTLLGLDQAKQVMAELYEKAENNLDAFAGFDGESLKEYLRKIASRRK